MKNTQFRIEGKIVNFCIFPLRFGQTGTVLQVNSQSNVSSGNNVAYYMKICSCCLHHGPAILGSYTFHNFLPTYLSTCTLLFAISLDKTNEIITWTCPDYNNKLVYTFTIGDTEPLFLAPNG